jgi:uroporphyrinogen III methyltransferase/synthase
MTVYLVGAGPGDPELLTVRAARLLSQAEVVVHDRLVDRRILELCSPAAKLIDVGKGPRGDSGVQESINALLVELGGSGATVVRLKGGDPFVFGRGGEEMEVLEAAGIPVEVVPGLSSALALPALAGVPVTSRGMSTSFVVVTGHAGASFPWKNLVEMGGTIIVMMGVESRGEMVSSLLSAGMDESTGVLVVERGATEKQRVVRTRLVELPDVHVEAPAVIVIGACVDHYLPNVESAPAGSELRGWKVVITRPESQAGELTNLLASHGAETLVIPAIEIGPPGDGGESLHNACRNLASFDWIVFTSANAVASFVEALEQLDLPHRSVLASRDVVEGEQARPAKIAAVGQATASALEDAGMRADVVGDQGAEALAGMLISKEGTRGLSQTGEGPTLAAHQALAGGEAPAAHQGPLPRALFVRGAQAMRQLPEALRGAGWEVIEAEVYSTRPRQMADVELATISSADAITFFSPSAANAVVKSLREKGRSLPDVVVSIGKTTTKQLRSDGVEDIFQAESPNLQSMLDALIEARRKVRRRASKKGHSRDNEEL